MTEWREPKLGEPSPRCGKRVDASRGWRLLHLCILRVRRETLTSAARFGVQRTARSTGMIPAFLALH